MRKRQRLWSFLLVCLLAFAVQGCLGIGGPSTKNVGTNTNGKQVSVVQDVFKGKIYATIGHNLYQITGDGQSHQLVGGGDVYDPAVSPDGTKIAFVQKYKQYSDLAYIASSGGSVHVLISGNGRFFINDGGYVHSTYHWFFEPAWSPDGSTLIFLSDWMKADYAQQCTGPMLTCLISRFSRCKSIIPANLKLLPTRNLVAEATAILAIALATPTRFSMHIMQGCPATTPTRLCNFSWPIPLKLPRTPRHIAWAGAIRAWRSAIPKMGISSRHFRRKIGRAHV